LWRKEWWLPGFYADTQLFVMVKKKHMIHAVIPLQGLSKGPQGHCFMIGKYLPYHNKLLSRAEVRSEGL
jgi:hypothetical protein